MNSQQQHELPLHHDLLTIDEAAALLRTPKRRCATGDTSAPDRQASASAVASFTAARTLKHGSMPKRTSRIGAAWGDRTTRGHRL